MSFAPSTFVFVQNRRLPFGQKYDFKTDLLLTNDAAPFLLIAGLTAHVEFTSMHAHISLNPAASTRIEATIGEGAEMLVGSATSFLVTIAAGSCRLQAVDTKPTTSQNAPENLLIRARLGLV